jgi:hypothetical protein
LKERKKGGKILSFVKQQELFGQARMLPSSLIQAIALADAPTSRDPARKIQSGVKLRQTSPRKLDDSHQKRTIQGIRSRSMIEGIGSEL